MKLRPYQLRAIADIRGHYAKGSKRVLLVMPTGAGKCLRGDTKVLMYDGTSKRADAVETGDLLMGPDSKSRTVLSTCNGRERMYTVRPTKGEEWGCNESHILSLVNTSNGDIVNISVKDYLNTTKWFKHTHKLYRAGIDLPEQQAGIDPYFYGLYLADGSKSSPQLTKSDPEIIQTCYEFAAANGLTIRDVEGNNCRELYFVSDSRQWFGNTVRGIADEMSTEDDRIIPDRYLYNSQAVRKQILAGILDGDGHLTHQGFEICTKYPGLRDGILYLARSLGLAAYTTVKKATIKSLGFEGFYHRIYISGHTDMIPTKVERKKAGPRKQIKDVLRTGFQLIDEGVGEYFGFEITGDRLFLLGDFTVTHNTATFCHILKSVQANGKRAMLCVRGVKLIDQASDRLTREGVDHGIIMRSDVDETKSIHCASVDTLYARKSVPKDISLLVIDEAHLANSASFKWVIDQYPDAFILAVTATPFHKEGFRSMADVIVEPITHQELIDQGYLVPGKWYVPDVPSLDTVKRSKGDYNKTDLSKVMNQSRLFGRIVNNWILRGENAPTLMFATSVSHSLRLVKSFIEAGVSALHVDAKTKPKERDTAIKMLETGEIKVLSSCDLLITGVDIPCLKNVIVARPTLSYNIHVQMIGRMTRTHPGKAFYNVFDHSGNALRHDFIHVHRHASLDGKVPLYRVVVQTCKVCFCTWSPAVSLTCPGILADGVTVCGEPIPKPEMKLTNIKVREDIELELSGTIEERERRKYLKDTIERALEKGLAKGYVYHSIKSRYGEEFARTAWRQIHEAYA